MNRLKRFCEDIREKCVSGHGVSVVNDNVDILSARPTTTQTLRQRSQLLRGHCVSVVNDYADTHEIILLWKSKQLRGHFLKTWKTAHRFLRNNQA